MLQLLYVKIVVLMSILGDILGKIWPTLVNIFPVRFFSFV